MRTPLRLVLPLLHIACLALLTPCATAQSSQSLPSQPPPIVLRLSIHDTIQPITAGYLQRGLHEAASLHAALVIVSLGTPGGLLDSTRSMVQEIESSPTPVAIYIAPAGSRAGSAGFFLLEAADIAAMAPGTNAGAAHPILATGPSSTQMDPILKEKIENDAAAFLRSYVTRRGRNVQAAEDAVRNSRSYSDDEALHLKLIDLVAPNDSGLIAALSGRTIHRFDGNVVTLDLRGATVRQFPPSLRERLLGRLTNPDLAVLLVVVGGLLLYLEFNVPGTIVPGALGTLLLLLGIFGLNLLPVSHTAVLLLVAAMVLIILEAKFASHGILALAAIVALIFGLATLVDGPIPDLRVHIATAIAAGISFGAISLALAWIALRARRSKVLTGPNAMIGAQAIARTDLTPSGQVEVRGEIWQATLPADLNLPSGATVRVKGVHDLVLLVESHNSGK